MSPRDAAGGRELGHDVLHHASGDREADALPAGGEVGHGRVDPDHATLEVHERPAAVPGVDGRVRLDEILVGGDGRAAPRPLTIPAVTA